MTRKYPARDLKLLWGLSAATCAFPGCKVQCIEVASNADPMAVVGKICHIEAHSDAGPRANIALTAEERDCYENWVLLCGTHHDVVDVQPNTYTSTDLRRWKMDHEAWVRDRLTEAMPEVSFAELEVVSKAIIHAPTPATADMTLTPPLDKMARNALTRRVMFEMTLGLAKAREVQDFVTHVADRDPSFPERLKEGFVAEYKRLREENLDGDDLFEAMREFAGRRSTDFCMQAAGLAVLAYLFEKCEVFEP